MRCMCVGESAMPAYPYHRTQVRMISKSFRGAARRGAPFFGLEGGEHALFFPIFAVILLTMVTMRFLTEGIQIHPNHGEY